MKDIGEAVSTIPVNGPSELACEDGGTRMIRAHVVPVNLDSHKDSGTQQVGACFWSATLKMPLNCLVRQAFLSGKFTQIDLVIPSKWLCYLKSSTLNHK
jgi:hypothetical protein